MSFTLNEPAPDHTGCGPAVRSSSCHLRMRSASPQAVLHVFDASKSARNQVPHIPATYISGIAAVALGASAGVDATIAPPEDRGEELASHSRAHEPTDSHKVRSSRERGEVLLHRAGDRRVRHV